MTAATRVACLCGCGDYPVGGLFRPGHDAKYASLTVKRVLSGDLTLEAGMALMPTSKLADQVQRWFESAR